MDWDTYEVARKDDYDGGWCQTYRTKRDAEEGLMALLREAAEVRSEPTFGDLEWSCRDSLGRKGW